MKNYNLIFTLAALGFSGQSFSYEMASKEYSVSTLYHGTIGEKKITMYLTTNDDIVTGKYIYDKFGNAIIIGGTKVNDGFVINEKLKTGSATITLNKNSKGYSGDWCSDKCIPIVLHDNTSFRSDGPPRINASPTDNSNYSLEIQSGPGVENISGDNALDEPRLNFTDLNNDGYYDLIISTDHRPTNGSQDVYLSTDHGFVKSKGLSSINGTLVFDPFKHHIIFNTKDDCCSKYEKAIYELHNGEYKKINKLSFD